MCAFHVFVVFVVAHCQRVGWEFKGFLLCQPLNVVVGLLGYSQVPYCVVQFQAIDPSTQFRVFMITLWCSQCHKTGKSCSEFFLQLILLLTGAGARYCFHIYPIV